MSEGFLSSASAPLSMDLRNGLNVHAGKLTCKPVAEAQGLTYTPPEQLAA